MKNAYGQPLMDPPTLVYFGSAGQRHYSANTRYYDPPRYTRPAQRLSVWQRPVPWYVSALVIAASIAVVGWLVSSWAGLAP